jgi:transcriptional regulator with GAF, ATPase, and Fis domain
LRLQVTENVTRWDSRHGKTDTRPGGRRAAAAPEPAQLRVVYPRDEIGTLPLPGGKAVLGRTPEPDGTRLRHSTVSRRHVEIAWNPRARASVVVDLDSHNGTAVNGVRIEPGSPVTLQYGDVVRIGDVLCVYEHGDGIDVADPPDVSRDHIPGDSAAARLLRAQVARAAADPSPVLIVGATGTGKERVAAELHRGSGRPGELVIVNCAAIPALLFESQLFGHVKGAFTGATSSQAGMFRAADKGTLFLDEIGETPADLQPKLLRAVQEGEIVAVGSSKAERVDVRVVAATNRALDADVERGAFRRDLYARLAMWQVRVPSLSDRRADLLGWFDRLCQAWYARRPERPPATLELDVDAAQALLLSPWRDNLRGLDRLVHELTAREAASQIGIADLPPWAIANATPAPAGAAPAGAASAGTASAAMASAGAMSAGAASAADRPPIPSRDELAAFLEESRFNVRAAARHFQRDRRQIYRWIEQFGIPKPRG